MVIVWYIFLFITGAVFGSFLNVLVDRVPARQSLLRPPSHCPNCNQQLKARDLIPVISYLLLKGKCRYCEAAIPRRILIVEMVTGLLFMFLFWLYGYSWSALLLALYGCTFIVLSVIDLEKGILPNVIVYSMAVVVIILSALQYFDIITILVPNIFNTAIGIDIMLSAAIGFGIGFIFFLILALVFRGGMGFGDVKLAGLIGLMTGFPLILIAVFTTSFIGGIAAIVLLVSKSKRRKDAVPFGPFLCIGAMITLLWGPQLLLWYLGGH